MSDQKHSYQQARQIVVDFFDTHFHKELTALRTGLSKPFLEELTSLRTDLFKIRKDDEQRYDQIILRLSDTIHTFKNLFSDTPYFNFPAAWQDALDNALPHLPEKIDCIQEQSRFRTSEKDPYKTRVLKKLKSILFGLRSSFMSAERKKSYQWTQEVPLRNLIHFTMVADDSAFRDITAREFSQIAQALTFLLQEIKEVLEEEQEEQSETKSTQPPVSDEYSSDFRIPAISRIESHIGDAIVLLKEFQENTTSFTTVIQQRIELVLHRIELAGTIEFSNARLLPTKLQSSITAKYKDALKTEQKWLDFLRSQITDLQVQLEIARFGAEMEDVQEDLLELTHAFFRDSCYLPTENGISILKDIIQQLRETKSPKKSIKEIEEVREKLQNEFIVKTLHVMQEDEYILQFQSDIQQLITDLELNLNQFSETLLLAEKRKPEFPHPILVLDTFQWRSIASRFLKNEAINHVQPKHQNFADFIASQLSDIEEAANIVDVNLQASVTSEENEGEGTPLEVAVSGLERAISALEKSIKNVRDKQNEYEALITSKLPEAFQKLAMLMLNRKYDEFEIRDKALQAKEAALGWQDKLSRLYAHVEEKTELFWRYGKNKFAQTKRPIAKILGFKDEVVSSARHRQDITEYLYQNKSISDNLPFIYQRLFKRSFVIDQRFFVDVNSNLQQLISGYKQWDKNIEWSMAVVGQKGSGKSTLLHFFQEQLDSKQQLCTISVDYTLYDPEKLILLISKSLGFAETNDVNVLIEKIQKSRKKKVVVFEGLQNIYVRNISGYQAIKQFWLLLSQTSDKLFWLVTSSGNAWNFFVKMFNADQFFSQIVRTDQLNQKQLEQGILARHKATGYELEFEATDQIRKSRAFRKLLGNKEEIQKYLQKKYFEQLSVIADGNFSIAMIFWVNSIKDFNETRFLMAPVVLADIDVLEVPSREVLFTLATLINHDTLTAAEVALALHQKETDSKLMLGRLKSKGLIIETSKGYTINHLVYRQVHRLLASRNILH